MSAKSDLYPLNFVTLASFSREYTLKITKVELELLTNVNVTGNYENAQQQDAFVIMLKEIINKCIIMMKQKKVHTFNIFILTISLDELYHKQFHMVN